MSPVSESKFAPDELMAEALEDLGVIGFNQYTDAIQQPLYNGVRIWYYRDGEIRRVSRTSDYQTRWQSPVSSDADSMKDVLSAADEFSVIDKRLHNTLASGALEDVSGAHEGIAWGVVLMFGAQLQRGSIPTARSLSCIPGVGDRISGRIRSALYAYPSEFFALDSEVRTDG